MFAFVGYIVHANGIKFPWAMQMDGTPFPSETNPPALWDAVSESAKWQIFSLIAFLEFWSELSTPNHKHYMAGGKPGDFPDFISGPDGIPHPVPFNYFGKSLETYGCRSALRGNVILTSLLCHARSLQVEQEQERRQEGTGTSCRNQQRTSCYAWYFRVSVH